MNENLREERLDLAQHVKNLSNHLENAFYKIKADQLNLASENGKREKS